MSRLGKEHVVRKTTRVVCKTCSTKKKGKQNIGPIFKRRRKRPVKVIVRAAKAPTVHVTTPEINVQTNPPEVHVTAPAPMVNIETPKPEVILNFDLPKPELNVNVDVPKPEINVNVDLPESSYLEELRDRLSDFRGGEIELITSAASGGQPPNRIGTLERLGRTTLTLRPTTGNVLDQIVVYSLCHIIGFRPYTPVEAS